MIPDWSPWSVEIVGFSLLAGLCAVFIVTGLVPRFVRRGSRRWIEKIRTPIDPETRTLVQQTRGRRQALTFVGAFLGLLAGMIASHTLAEPFSPMHSVILMGCFAAGLLLGQSLRGLVVVLRQSFGSVRVTHARATRTSDYVHPAAQTIVRVEVVVMVALCVAAALSPAWIGIGFTEQNSGPLWLAAGLILLTAVISEITVVRAVDRPSPGATANSLVWHDALRRELVQDLFSTPTAVGPLLILMASQWMTSGGDRSTLDLSWWGIGVYMVAMCLPMIIQQLNQDRPAVVAA